MAKHPDIIFIWTDQERAAPSYENDALAAWRREALSGRQWFIDNGVSFERHYAAATACVPSRAAMLTGHSSHLHGVDVTDGLAKHPEDPRMRYLRPGEVPTIGDWFQAGDYDVHYDGKWHVSDADLRDSDSGEPIATNTDDGEILPEGVRAYEDADPLAHLGLPGWVGPEPHGADAANSGLVRDPLIADRVVTWLRDRYARRRAGDAAAQRPFLLMVSFINPHDIVFWPAWGIRSPLKSSPQDPPEIPPPPTVDEDLADKPAAQSAYRSAYPSGFGPVPFIRRLYDGKRSAAYRSTYYRLHLEVDGLIDRVRREVTDESGSGEAYLALTSDHGEMLGAHGGQHQKWFSLYDEALRLPLTIAHTGTGTVPRAVGEIPTSHLDLLPTLMSLAGLDEEALRPRLEQTHTEVHPLPGHDLAPILADPAAVETDRAVYFMSGDNVFSGEDSVAIMGRLLPGNPSLPGFQIKVPEHVGEQLEAVVVRVPGSSGGADHVWKLVRTYDDPGKWDEPGVRHLAARKRGGDVFRTEPLVDEWELYDLDQDPSEAVNRWDDAAASDVQSEMLGRLEQERARVDPGRNEPWPYSSPTTKETRMPEVETKRPSAPFRAIRAVSQRLGFHPDDENAAELDLSGRRALIVNTSHGVLDIGKATGVFASEMTAPYYTFLDAGMDVDLASIRGGAIPIDPLSVKAAVRSEHDDRFLADPVLREKVTNSRAIAEVDIGDYEIVFLAGGWGAAFDFADSEALAEKMTEANAAGEVLGGVCHGPLGLVGATAKDGKPLVEGRKMTSVTDKQVSELGIDLTPYHPETELRAKGADFESKSARRDILANHYVVDGNLVTGQNQNAGPMVAREMMQRLLARDAEAAAASA